MFVDPNQSNPYNKIFESPNVNYDLQGTWSLLRTIIRKRKIKKIYGTKDSDRKEKF